MTTAVAVAVTCQRERLIEVWQEALPLLYEHYREIAHYQDIAFRPDLAAYQTSEALDLLRIYTARVDGRLVGYAVFFVRHSPHYSDSLQATQDILYVAPAARGTTGLRLVQFAEAQLKAEGVEVLYHHVKVKHPKLGQILERSGYEAIDIIYGKRLA